MSDFAAGTGDGFIICAIPEHTYDIQMISNRWNESSGFWISTGQNRVLEQGPWTGTSIIRSLNSDGAVNDGSQSVIDSESCVVVEFHNSAVPTIFASSPVRSLAVECYAEIYRVVTRAERCRLHLDQVTLKSGAPSLCSVSLQAAVMIR